MTQGNRGRQLFYHGQIFTADEGRPEATALVVEDGRIIFVGSDEEAEAFAGEGVPRQDLEERRVVPGFIDTHAHYGIINSTPSDGPTLTIDQSLGHGEVLSLIADYAREHPPEEVPVIFGTGYGLEIIPLATELDKAVSDRPAVLMDSGGHAGWFNTMTMAAVGIDAETPDPLPGKSFFERDERGRPNGHFFEIDTMAVIAKKLGLNSGANIAENLPGFISSFLSPQGFTGYYDAGFILVDDADAVTAMAGMDVPMRIFTSFTYRTPLPVAEFLAVMTEVREKYTSETLRPTTLKLFKDGTVEAYSSLMAEGYANAPEKQGIEILSNQELMPMAKAAADAGFNIHIHAIGDQAITDALDVYAELGEIAGTKAIAHVQILPPDGVERFGRQGDVVYQTTPVWALADEFTYDALGAERYARQMPIGTLTRQGTVVTFGSDAPVSNGLEGVNPFLEIYHAVNRGVAPGNYVPPVGEGISVGEAVKCYTINAAVQMGCADEFGSLTIGKSADFVVLDRDIMTTEVDDIPETKVLATYFRGVPVYKA